MAPVVLVRPVAIMAGMDALAFVVEVAVDAVSLGTEPISLAVFPSCFSTLCFVVEAPFNAVTRAVQVTFNPFPL
jgi:hypothetical protein